MARLHSTASGSASRLAGQCVNPTKLRGNKQPFESMVDLLGSTPLLCLNALTNKIPALAARPVHERPEIFVKLESTNPGWSVKARPAVHMIEQAEKRGDIGPDTVIIESSSGNTAIAIAMVAAMKGYTFKPVVDVKMPQAKCETRSSNAPALAPLPHRLAPHAPPFRPSGS